MGHELRFEHRGIYQGRCGRLEMAFASEETDVPIDGIGPLYRTGVEVANGLDFDAIRADATGPVRGRYDKAKDTMRAIAAGILTEVMPAHAEPGWPDDAHYDFGWALDGTNFRVTYDRLTVQLMPNGSVRISASG